MVILSDFSIEWLPLSCTVKNFKEYLPRITKKEYLLSFSLFPSPLLFFLFKKNVWKCALMGIFMSCTQGGLLNAVILMNGVCACRRKASCVSMIYCERETDCVTMCVYLPAFPSPEFIYKFPCFLRLFYVLVNLSFKSIFISIRLSWSYTACP